MYMDKKVYYPCFSSNLKEFLKNKNFKYLVKCRHIDSLVPMWIYLYDDAGLLDKYLEEWKTVRKTYKKDLEK